MDITPAIVPTPQKIRIGWASRDITPDKAVNVIGQLHARVSDRVLDRLTVTALALASADGGEQAIMVSADIAVIQEHVLDQARQVLRQQLTDFDPSRLVVNATHTHNAPASVPLVRYPPQAAHVMPTEAYDAVLGQRIGQAAVEAWNSRRPGAVAWGCGQAVVGFNRRMVYHNGMARMYGNTNDPDFSHIEGYEDHGLDMLFTYDADERLTGMVLNLACPSQVSESEALVSADFWHDARQLILQRHGRDLFVLPQCSAAGDQSPHPLLKKSAEARMLKLKGLLQEGEGAHVGERREIGRRIAAAVDEVLPLASKDLRREVVFKHVVVNLDLPRRMISDEEARAAAQLVEEHQAKLAGCDPDPAGPEYSRSYVMTRRFGAVVERHAAQSSSNTLQVEVHVLRLGDIALATNRFEYFLDYGLRIKARSKAIQTFVVQLAGPGSYLPTERALHHRSYGAGPENSLVTPAGGQTLANETVRQINSLFP